MEQAGGKAEEQPRCPNSQGRIFKSVPPRPSVAVGRQEGKPVRGRAPQAGQVSLGPVKMGTP